MSELISAAPRRRASPEPSGGTHLSKRCTKPISQFLSFAKPFEARLTRCTADTVAERALQLAERAAAEKGVTLSCHLDDGLPVSEADALKLAQALGNLLRNAVEAVRQEGNVALHVTVSEARIIFRG